MAEREIRKLELENGRVPFDDWFESLGDLRMQAAVDARLARVRAGNFGDHKGVGAGVFELRMNAGPGLRLYYGEHRKQLVILLGGGHTATQTRNIHRAKQLWQNGWDLTNISTRPNHPLPRQVLHTRSQVTQRPKVQTC